jgi:hypothetical protein
MKGKHKTEMCGDVETANLIQQNSGISAKALFGVLSRNMN